MLGKRSILKVADNSGAQRLEIINIYGSTGRKFASVGDIVQCTVKKADPNGIVKTHEMVLTVLVRTKRAIGRPDGSYIRFDDNAGVVIDSKKDRNPKGTRVFGPVARELKELGYDKIVSMAKEVW